MTKWLVWFAAAVAGFVSLILLATATIQLAIFMLARDGPVALIVWAFGGVLVTAALVALARSMD